MAWDPPWPGSRLMMTTSLEMLVQTMSVSCPRFAHAMSPRCLCWFSWFTFAFLVGLQRHQSHVRLWVFSTERAATLELDSLFRYITKQPMGSLPRRALTLERMQTSMRTCLPCPRSTEHQVGKSALFVGTQRMCCASHQILPMLTT